VKSEAKPEGEESASSYYDTEEESEEDLAKPQGEPKTEEIIDLSGNYPEKAEELKKNALNAATEEELPKNHYDSSELFLKMRQEWESLQNNPSAVDDQIKAQLKMLE